MKNWCSSRARTNEPIRFIFYMYPCAGKLCCPLGFGLWTPPCMGAMDDLLIFRQCCTAALFQMSSKITWILMIFHGFWWFFMDFNDFSWILVIFRGFCWFFHGFSSFVVPPFFHHFSLSPLRPAPARFINFSTQFVHVSHYNYILGSIWCSNKCARPLHMIFHGFWWFFMDFDDFGDSLVLK